MLFYPPKHAQLRSEIVVMVPYQLEHYGYLQINQPLGGIYLWKSLVQTNKLSLFFPSSFFLPFSGFSILSEEDDGEKPRVIM